MPLYPYNIRRILYPFTTDRFGERTNPIEYIIISADSSLDAPSSLSATAVSDTQIDLTWTDNSDNETGFEVYRSTTSGSGYSLVTTTAADATSYSDTGRSEDTTYYYIVRAVNDDTESAYTSEANAITELTAPSDSAASASTTDAEITITWTDNSSSETGYEIHRATAAEGPFSLVNTTAANAETWTDTTVSADTQYWYRVRAVSTDTSNTSSYDSDVNATVIPAFWSEVVSLTAPTMGTEQTVEYDATGAKKAKLFILMSSGCNLGGGVHANAGLMFGAATPDDEAVVTYWKDEAATSDCLTRYLRTAALSIFTGTSTLIKEASFSEHNDGNSVLTFSTSETEAGVDYSVLALGGTEFEAELVDVTMPASNDASFDVTHTIAPDAYILFGTFNTTTGTNGAAGGICLGWCDGTTEYGQSNIGLDNNNPPSEHRTFSTGDVFSLGWSGTMRVQASHSSLEADGYVLNVHTTNGGTRACTSVAIRAPNVSVLNYEARTTTGSQSVTGAGFTPLACLEQGNHNIAAQDNTVGNFDFMNIGMCDSDLDQAGFGTKAQHAVADADRACATSGVFIWGDGAVSAQADIDSFDSDGITYDFTAQDGNAYSRSVLLIG